MPDLLKLFVSTFLTLFVILDPPGLLPVFLGLTRRMSDLERATAALKSSVVAFAIIASFALFGRFILAYLHVSVPALQVAGGLLLLLVALELLMGKGDEVSPAEGVNVAIVPMGTPLLAGPGTIVAIMLAVDDLSHWGAHLVVAAALISAMFSVFLFLRFSNQINRVLRRSGVTLASRIAGLLLSTIAVQMCADGVLGFVPA